MCARCAPGRRAFLAGAVASALGIAGCRASTSGTPAGDVTPAASPPGQPAAGSTTRPAPITTGAPAPGDGVSAPLRSAEGTAAVAVPGRRQLVERYRDAVPRAWGLRTPGVRLTLGTAGPAVALTFDACGGPHAGGAGSGYDRELITVLRRHQVRATLFLNRRWLAANPRISDELLADPLFEIGNHGTRHVPLSVTGRSAYGLRGTAGPGQVYDEIMINQLALAARMGRGPAWFRPGTAHCDDVAVRLAGDLGVRVAGFSVNADEGATAGQAQVAARLDAVRGGDIVISHLNHPEGRTAEGYREALPRLLDRGLRPVTLSEVPDR